MKHLLGAILLLAGASVARAQGDGGGDGGDGGGGRPRGEDKQMLVVYDPSYEDMARAEGLEADPRFHLGAYIQPVREYLSDANRFFLTFRRGLALGTWRSPKQGKKANKFLRELTAQAYAGDSTSWAIVVGLTGKYSDEKDLAGRSFIGLPRDITRHSTIFYPVVRDVSRAGDQRRRLASAVVCHEIGHVLSLEHHDVMYVPKNRPCCMDVGDVFDSYRYCSNHEAMVDAYQRSKRGHGHDGSEW